MKNKSSQAQSEKSDETDLGFIVDLFEKRWTILGFTVIAGLLGLFYAQLVTPTYRAHAVIQVDDNQSDLMGFSELYDEPPSANTQIQILESRSVIGKVVDSLNLEISAKPKSFPVVGEALVRLLGRGAGLFDWVLPSYSWGTESIIVPHFEVSESWRGEMFVVTKTSPQTYTLSYEGEILLDGKLGERRDADEISVQITELEGPVGSQYLLSRKARLDAINKLQRDLSASEKVEETGIFNLYYESDSRATAKRILNSIVKHYLDQNVNDLSVQAEDSLVLLNEQLRMAKERLNAAEKALSELKYDAKSVDLPLETQAVLQKKQSIDEQLQQLVYLESDLARRYTKNHPQYAALLEKRGMLGTQRQQIEKQTALLPVTQQEILRRTRDVTISQEIYTQLLEQTQELNVVKAGTVGTARLLDSAEVNKDPVSPKKKLLLIVSLVLGFASGIGFVLVQRAFFCGVMAPEEIEALGLSVNASIPKSEAQERFDLAGKPRVLSMCDPTDLTVEALRSLRTNLHFTMRGASNNILAVTGAAEGVGKSFIASNISSLIANAQRSTLLIDADMRKGKLGQLYAANSKFGLSEYLAGEAPLDYIVNVTTHSGLSLIPKGKRPSNPSELLMSPRFKELLDWAADNFDLVIVDTPPILSVTDAAIIGQYTGALFLVVRYDHTTLREIRLSRHRFEQNGVHINGTVFNGVDSKEAQYYGYK